MKTAIDFKNAAIRKEIKRWDIHNCSMCNYACGYVIDNDRVFYDSGCDCTYRGQNLSPRSFEDIAEHYNMQSNEAVIQRMNEFWGFSDNETSAENLENNPTQLLENWEKELELIWEKEVYCDERYSPEYIIDENGRQKLKDSRSDLEEKLKGVRHLKYPIPKICTLIDKLLKLQEAKTREECAEIVEQCKMRGVASGQDNFPAVRIQAHNAALKEAQQQILDLNNQK